MTPWQDAGRSGRRLGIARRGAAAGLLAAALFPSAVQGFPVAEESRPGPGVQDPVEVRTGVPCPQEELKHVLRTAVTFAHDGNADAAGAVLARALTRCTDHPELLGGLAGVRIRQGHLAEAEGLAARLVRIQPDSDYGWELLAVTRYLQDDGHGALRAWSRGAPRVVRERDLRILGSDGPGAPDAGPVPVGITGIHAGRPLTVEGLVRGERRLAALPAAARTRLGYRSLPGGGAAIHGTVVLGKRSPFAGPDLLAHGLRLVGRRVHLVSADPLGRLERWELSGTLEGTLRRVGIALAHPAPGGFGVWRWEVDHERGRYRSTRFDGDARETRTSIGWSHTEWVTASLRGAVHGRIDARRERGTFAGSGVRWTFLPLTRRGAIGAEATGWQRIERGTGGGKGTGDETRFGRVEIRASLQPPVPPGVDAPSGLAGRLGVVAVSRGIPPDLMPRIGAGGQTALLMRARSDLNGDGVVRPLFPGTAWAHGGMELLHPVRSVGPVGLGVAVFADGVRVLARDRRADDATARRGAVHLGTGMRARIPWVDGWLRVDWGFDPAGGASTVSAAWVHEHRLNSLLVR